MRRIKAWFRLRSLDRASRHKIRQVQQITGSKVYEPLLYLRALRHRSKLIESNMRQHESYEQLEFLGDAVLDLIVTELIFDRFANRNEGFMTQMRSRIVKGETLAKFSQSLNLSDLIEVGDRVKDQGIEFSTSVLADTFEALVGALYLDSGIEPTRKFVSNLVDRHIDFNQLELNRDNYKSVLLEYTQSHKLPPPVYKVESMSGPDHDRTFEIRVVLGNKEMGRGTGKNKKKAEQIAAHETLELIQKPSESK